MNGTGQISRASRRRTSRLGEMLKLWRKEHKLSTRTVAAAIGIPTSTLHRIERDVTGMTAGNFLRFSQWMLQRSDNGHRIRR